MAKIFELPDLRDKIRVFKDRTDAGRVLCSMLKERKKELSGGIILAIPSGGVPIGIELSKCLHLPLDCIVVRKVQIPGNPEAGFGAVTLQGDVFLNEELLAYLDLSQDEIDEGIEKVKRELQERNRLFRKMRPLPDLSGKKVIIADDGLASGFTMLASVESVRRMGAEKIIIAVPTASPASISKLSPKSDEIYCPNIRGGRYFAVAEAYVNWYDLSKREVVNLLDEHEKTWA